MNPTRISWLSGVTSLVWGQIDSPVSPFFFSVTVPFSTRAGAEKSPTRNFHHPTFSRLGRLSQVPGH